MLSAGAVHEGTLYVPRVNSQDRGADLSTYNFDSREWDSLSCNEPRPTGCLVQLLAVHDDVLIRYGRKPWQSACLHCYALHVTRLVIRCIARLQGLLSSVWLDMHIASKGQVPLQA